MQGSVDTVFGFTGEQTDGNSQVYLRARYYNPSIGVFNSLDPFEGVAQRPMSLNGYSWVEGNTPNMVDPSGMCFNRSVNNPIDATTESGRREIQTCFYRRNVLRSQFGVTLTQVDSLNFNEVWTTERVSNMLTAARVLSQKYNGIGLSYNQVFNGITMTIENGEDQDFCATTPGTDEITWYPCKRIFDDPWTVDNIIHEYGHILQNRAGREGLFSMSGWWEIMEKRARCEQSQCIDAIRANPGLGFASPDLRQNDRAEQLNPNDRIAEEVADMFLFWVRGYPFSAGDDTDNGTVGQLRSDFVAGNLTDFPLANGGPVNNLGMVRWSQKAAGLGGAGFSPGIPTMISLPIFIPCLNLPSLPPSDSILI